MLGLGGTADEVVVHKEDVASPAKIVQNLQFLQDLAGSLGAHPASQHEGDVAEFAVKRAAPGELQGHIQVAVQVNQVKAGRRGMLQVSMARRGDDFARLAPLQTIQELRHDEFRFPRHRQVGSRSQGVFGEMEGPGAPHHHGLAPPFAFLDGLHDAVMLDDHPGDENQVALFPVLRGDILEGQVPEPRPPTPAAAGPPR